MATTGFCQDRPSAERETVTPTPLTALLMTSPVIIHVPCLASKATLGSDTRANVPPPWKTVMPGSIPCCHVAPPSVEVLKLMSEPPPSLNRPTCDEETIVLPNENVSGSTSVACWLV